MSTAIAAIQQAARHYGIRDWKALAAVANAESGLDPGSVGDGGTSFGLFQLHQGGALGNMGTSQARQYLDAYRNASFAAKQIRQMGLHNLTGRDAISAFVSRFERPANPSGEIERAYQWYTGGGGAAPAAAAPPPSSPTTAMGASSSPTPDTALSQSIIDSNAKQFHLPRINLPVVPRQLGVSVQPDGIAPAQMPHPNDVGQAIVQAAKNFLGVKYVWGGTSPKTGFDCSGLVKYVMNKFGINIARVSEEQFKGGMPVNQAQARPGDLVFFTNGHDVHHVGIYAGNGMFIQAPHTGDVVKISPLSSRSDIAGFRRYAA